MSQRLGSSWKMRSKVILGNSRIDKRCWEILLEKVVGKCCWFCFQLKRMWFGKVRIENRKIGYGGWGQQMKSLEPILDTNKIEKCWRMKFLMSGKTKSGETSTGNLRIDNGVPLEPPKTSQMPPR